MDRRIVLGIAGLAVAAASLAFAPDKNKDKGKDKPAAGQAMELPEGMTPEDMQACMEAGTPGKMHEELAKKVGVWTGECKMWMSPGGEAMESPCTMTVTPMMDGRYFRTELSGEMPGMGPYHGFGITGYDNAAEQFQNTWVDNWSTGIMSGTGEMSSDGKTMTWTCTYHCPVTDKPVTMREVERWTGPDTYVLEFHGKQPRGEREYKMMEITFKRQKDGKSVTSAK